PPMGESIPDAPVGSVGPPGGAERRSLVRGARRTRRTAPAAAASRAVVPASAEPLDASPRFAPNARMIEGRAARRELLAPAATRCEGRGAPPVGGRAGPPTATAVPSSVVGAALTAGLCVIGAIVAAVTVPTTVQARAGHNEDA